MISYDCVLLDNNSHSLNYLERRKEIDSGFPNGTIQLISEEIPKAPIKIEDDVWIGINTMVFKGITIGSKSVIAAGTCLTKSVVNNSLIYGNPNQRKEI
jgi:acetyltransferase-like isoleucine patch superfamily enzyme